MILLCCIPRNLVDARKYVASLFPLCMLVLMDHDIRCNFSFDLRGGVREGCFLILFRHAILIQKT